MTHTYYHPRDLYREGVQVILLVGGQEVDGYVTRFTQAGKPKWRIGLKRGNSHDVPAAKVEAWRPIKPETWPEPLPEPMRMTKEVNWQSPPEPQSEPESGIGEEWWVNPRTRLGTAGEPPVSALECEIRILRCICTQEAMDFEPIKIESCWPKDLEISAKVVAKNLRASRTGMLPGLRREDYSDIHVDTSELDARIARWTSYPRDVSDWENWPKGTGPAFWAAPEDYHLFVLRAQRYSTGSIARAMRVPEKDIVLAFQVARDKAFRRATA